MTEQERMKRDDLAKAKLLQLIVNAPDVTAESIPVHLRRWLRPLEKAGIIQCDSDYVWHIRSVVTIEDDGHIAFTWDDYAKIKAAQR